MSRPLSTRCDSLTHLSVIMPTVESLLKAIRYYEAQGGSASIYVNEDGMQVVDPELAEYDTLLHLMYLNINHPTTEPGRRTMS